jgi:ATP phosphoribosyltransferase
MALEFPGMALEFPGMASKFPGMASKFPGMALEFPGMALEFPGMALEFPGLASKFPCRALEFPCRASKSPGKLQKSLSPSEKAGFVDRASPFWYTFFTLKTFSGGAVDTLRILIPKGRIFDKVAGLFRDAGFPLSQNDRGYRPFIGADWLQGKIMKPQNVGELLELGSHDAGFTGLDWIQESKAEVTEMLDLGFDRVRIVAAVPADRDEQNLREKRLTVATEYPGLAEAWLSRSDYRYRILRTYGATEVFPPDDADMIIDNTASGQTLKDNGLRIIGTLLESSTRFVAGPAALKDPAKRGRIEELVLLFKAVLAGRDRVMLEMNVSKSRFSELISAQLPSMRSPTIAALHNESGYAVKIAVKKTEVPALIPQLQKLGAADIVEYDLRKAVL